MLLMFLPLFSATNLKNNNKNLKKNAEVGKNALAMERRLINAFVYHFCLYLILWRLQLIEELLLL